MAQIAAQHVFVVGGNGFLGSAICKAAVARGWKVTSISSSGQPYRTPKGHTPAWTSKVDFHKASALEPASYRDLLKPCTAVVHTLGILLEAPRYKFAVRSSSLGELVSSFGHAWGLGAAGNPLKKREPGQEGTYESVNTTSALRVLESYVSCAPASNALRPFVYISAEDIFRPLVPTRYIESKRAAEAAISRDGRVRGVYLRPGLMYHPHTRPLTTPLATLLDISANMHKNLPIPGPANLLRAFSSTGLAQRLHPSSANATSVLDTPLDAMARALETPPVHVEHVAQAACEAIARGDVSGPYGVRDMRELIGWGNEAETRTSETRMV